MISRIVVFGASGLVGGGLVRALHHEAKSEVLCPKRRELDLVDPVKVGQYLRARQPDVVILAAAKVGGIAANIGDPVGFLVDNLAIQNNVIIAAVEAGVEGIMFLGSSCIYPREAEQPITEEAFMTGPLEPTNESYAVAKIAGIRLMNAVGEANGIRTWLPMPSNIYGTGDHFDLDRSHVLSALVRRFVEAKRAGRREVELWGTGTARREFLHVDDLARACLHLLNLRDDLGLVNVGYGSDVTIRELAELIAEETGFRGEIHWDATKPDGMPRKLLDSSRITASGWTPLISLEEGVRRTVREYLGQN